MSDSELIDWEQLSMIFGEDEDEFDDDMAELFQEFVEDGLQRFAGLKAAAFPEQKDFIAKESHKLKGSASNFGFARVAALLGHLEDDIESLDQQDLESTLNEAARDFDSCVEQVVGRYPALKAN